MADNESNETNDDTSADDTSAEGEDAVSESVEADPRPAEEDASSSANGDASSSGSSGGSNEGTVEQVIGVVIDAVFPDELPEIYSALKIEIPEGDGATRSTSPSRSNSTPATTGSARWPWTRPTDCVAATP